jgi:hypothetical protein
MSEAQRGVSAPTAQRVFLSCRSGLAILLEAIETAKELQLDAWDFAVEIQNLRSAGLTSSGLRWLLCKGYVEHAIETTQAAAAQRTFQPAGNLMLCEASCFVLTPAGVALARGGRCHSVDWKERGTLNLAQALPDPGAAARPKVPRWDAACPELHWGPMLVKRFRLPALNQELILSAFEEEGWPPHIDDPLPNPFQHDPKQRLHDTIKRLNRHQVNQLVRFRADGSGCGIIWELWG